MQYQIITINTHLEKNDSKGGLSFFEGMKTVPFEIKRFYYIYGVSAGETRGFHAHKELKQLLFCPYGKIRINLDDGKNQEAIILENPSMGLLLEPGLWRTMDWLADNSVLCVAASEYYTEDDYIRNYKDFLAYISENRGEDL